MSTVSVVLFSLGLIQMDLNEKDKILTMSMWTRYAWKDEYLRWDPKDYDGIITIRLSADLIWIPDIMLYNTASVETVARDALAVINYNGRVMWYPHTVFKSSCSVDVTNFPFDNQSCHMWFGSWTYTNDQIDLKMMTKEGIDLSTYQSDFKEGSVWDIYEVHAEKEVKGNEKTKKFSIVVFYLNMKRRIVFSTYILTLPCIFLACLTLVVFWLPPDRPDRTSLAMSIFASFMVLLLILVEAAPPTAGSIPKLGLYYCFNVVIIMLAIVLSSLVVNIYRGGADGKKPPKWLNAISLNCIVCLLCKKHKLDKRRYRKERNTEICDENVEIELESIDSTFELHGSYSERRMYTCDSKRHLSDFEKQIADLKRMLAQMESKESEKIIANNMTQEAKKAWQRIATMLDRFFFILYFVLIIASLSLTFPRPS
ncbi:DgyrCDS3081 [Dimorphilus gyrociliatus]|uniref:DgyrCDS3081 n=1 Tax=Dimorphilus gyrociliatus TaxID=2664684 RepID=A0A7I8VF57_9ANNE|nr:DgyrCDS3081 [Dimorphilus gyrociliatus]